MTVQPIEEVASWSASRSLWQQDALRRIAVTGSLSPEDKGEILSLLKIAAGFEVNSTPANAVPFAAQHFTGASPGQSVAIKQIKDVTGVNRLKVGASLEFAPTGLTVVYGRNGSGKSGYARILRSACRTRLDSPSKLKVLTNVYGVAGGAQTAIIVVDHAGAEKALVWDPAHPRLEELQQVAVFDSAAAALYVDQGHHIRFLPFGLDLLYKLNELCIELKATLEGDRAQASAGLLLAVIPFTESRETASQKFYQGLTGAHDDSAIAAATVFGTDEQKRLDDLDELLGPGTVTSSDLKTLASWLNGVAASCATITSSLSDKELEGLCGLRKELDASRKAASMNASDLFEGEPLRGVGEEVWRLLWAAAREYSLTIAYPSAQFPVVERDGEGAACVLCQQPLSVEAANRLQRFQEFVAGALNKKADDAATRVNDAQAALPNLDALKSDDWTSRVEQVRSRDAALADRLMLFCDWAIQRSMDAIQILAGTLEGPTSEALTCPSCDLTDLAGALKKQGEALAESEDPVARKVLVDEQHELADRKKLSASVDQLKARRDLLRTLRNYDKALAEVQTTPVTTKANKLVETHLTTKVVDQFNTERNILEIAHLQIGVERESGKTGAKFGTKSGTHVTKASSDFLSEGEQRALALSAFLTEITMTEGAGPIVVDDPVSSLDRERCRKVAERLVREAQNRQVIIFTHDLIFYNDLAIASHATGCELASVALYANTIAAGQVDPGGVNWHGKPLAQRIPTLKAEAKSIEGLHDSSPSDYEYKAKNLYSRLRDTYERVVEESIFAGVISRGADRIETLKLRYVHVSDDIANKFYQGMTTANTYSHDNPASATVDAPTPAKMLEHISELEAVIELSKTERIAAEGRRPLMKGLKTSP